MTLAARPMMAALADLWAGPTLRLTDVGEAMEALAVRGLELDADPRRRWLCPRCEGRVDPERPCEACAGGGCEAPATAMAAVSWGALGGATVLAAEALARETAARLIDWGGEPTERVLWRPERGWRAFMREAQQGEWFWWPKGIHDLWSAEKDLTFMSAFPRDDAPAYSRRWAVGRSRWVAANWSRHPRVRDRRCPHAPVVDVADRGLMLEARVRAGVVIAYPELA